MNTIDVMTGEVKFAGRHDTLQSHAIGSCIVISAYDPKQQFGGMAHIMLPGKAPANKAANKKKYAHDAIDALMKGMDKGKNNCDHLQVCMVGGGNVLKKEDDTICQQNIDSVRAVLRSKHIEVCAESLGGIERRTMKLIIKTGKTLFSIGNSAEISLYDPFTKGKE